MDAGQGGNETPGGVQQANIAGLLYYVRGWELLICTKCHWWVPDTDDFVRDHLTKHCGKKAPVDVDVVIKSLRDVKPREDGGLPHSAPGRAAELRAWFDENKRPAEPRDPIPCLPALGDGRRCNFCPTLTATRQGMGHHIDREHANEERRPRSNRPANSVTVCVQELRFADTPRARVYVETTRTHLPSPDPAPTDEHLTARERLERLDDHNRDRTWAVARPEAMTDPNCLASLLGFDRHLNGLVAERLGDMMSTASCPEALNATMGVLERICRRAVDDAEGTPVPELIEWNRRSSVHVAQARFNFRVQQRSFTNYLSTWRKILTYADNVARRAQPPAPGDGMPTCELTPRQRNLVRAVMEPGAVAGWDTEAAEAVVRELVYSLIDDSDGDPFRMLIPSALAVLGFRQYRGGLWHTAKTYGAPPSHVIKVAIWVLWDTVEHYGGLARRRYAGAERRGRDEGHLDDEPAYTKRDDRAFRREADETQEPALVPLPPVLSDRPRGQFRVLTAVRQGATRLDLVEAMCRRTIWPDPPGRGDARPVPWTMEAQRKIADERHKMMGEERVVWDREGDGCTVGAARYSVGTLGDAMRAAMDAARDSLRRIFAEADPEGFEARWGRVEAVVPPLTEVTDSHDAHAPGHCFLEDAGNRGWAKEAGVVLLEVQAERYGSARSDGAARRLALEARAAQFLRDLAVAMYMTSGQVPRRTEMMPIKLRNGPAGRRNVLVVPSRGTVGFVVEYTKRFWASGARPIARLLPRALGRLLVLYAAAVEPLRLAVALQHDPDAEDKKRSTRLFALRTAVAPADDDARDRLADDELTKGVTALTEKTMGQPTNVRAYRHVMIAFARRHVKRELLLPRLLQMDDKEAEAFEDGWRGSDDDDDDDDDDLGGPVENLLTRQAGHSGGVSLSTYAVAAGTVCSAEHFYEASVAMHRAFRIEDHEPGATAGTTPAADEGDEDDGGEPPRPGYGDMARDDYLQVALGRRDVAFRDYQRRLMEARDRHRRVVLISGTGGGKSIAWQVPAYEGRGQTIVIQPLVTLQQQSHADLGRLGMRSVVWRDTGGEGAEAWEGELAQASVIFVSPESLTLRPWKAFLARLVGRGARPDAVVLDEAQEVLGAHDGWRPQLRDVRQQMDEISEHQVFLTGTLPPSLEDEFLCKLKLYRADAGIDAVPNSDPALLVRAPTLRKNLRFCHRRSRGRDDLLGVVRGLLEGLGPKDKAIVYRSSRGGCEGMAAALGGAYYVHADRTAEDKADAVARWDAGGGIMVATTALGLGVNFKGVVLVVTVDPKGGMDMYQQFGRAARDPEAGSGTAVLVTTYDSGDEAVRDYARDRCRRQAAASYLDGDQDAACCGYSDVPCDRCCPRASPTAASGLPWDAATALGSSSHATLSTPSRAIKRPAYESRGPLPTPPSPGTVRSTPTPPPRAIKRPAYESHGPLPTAPSPGTSQGAPRGEKRRRVAEEDMSSAADHAARRSRSDDKAARQESVAKLQRWMAAYENGWRMGATCVSCQVHREPGADEAGHGPFGCPKHATTYEQVNALRAETNRGPGVLAKYSACFRCLRPQAWCQELTGGPGSGCYGGKCSSIQATAVLELLAVLVTHKRGAFNEAMRKLGSRATLQDDDARGPPDGKMLGRPDEAGLTGGGWLRQKTKVPCEGHKMETNNLIVTIATCLDDLHVL